MKDSLTKDKVEKLLLPHLLRYARRYSPPTREQKLGTLLIAMVFTGIIYFAIC